MDSLKSALEHARETIDSAYQESQKDRRVLHALEALRYLYEAVKDLEAWQAMLLELHKAREPLPGEGHDWNEITLKAGKLEVK